MSLRTAANDSDSDAEAETLEEKIKTKLVNSGELERLKTLLKQSLTECGWKEEVKQLCKEFVERRGVGNVTPEDIVRAVRSLGHRAVSDTVKAEFVGEVKKAVQQALQ
ncbi:hypothetical protein BSKO_01559 [Bryopsis sp. KO-2023]|nr:hypothetical protein BSKO_01559 [Bryopsis sp. KO-2023]